MIKTKSFFLSVSFFYIFSTASRADEFASDGLSRAYQDSQMVTYKDPYRANADVVWILSTTSSSPFLISAELNKYKKRIEIDLNILEKNTSTAVAASLYKNSRDILAAAAHYFTDSTNESLSPKEREALFRRGEEECSKAKMLISQASRMIANLNLSVPNAESQPEQSIQPLVSRETIPKPAPPIIRQNNLKTAPPIVAPNRPILPNTTEGPSQPNVSSLQNRVTKSPVLLEGKVLKLQEFLKDRNPVVDAYKRSGRLKDGEKGKSKTLEIAIYRLKKSPWTSIIAVGFIPYLSIPKYNPRISTISSTVLDARQVEQFVHEAFHATHQALAALYFRNRPPTKQEFVQIMTNWEASSYVAEINVHNEITAAMGAKPITYKWFDKKNRRQPDKDLSKLYAEYGFSALRTFIINEARTLEDIDGEPVYFTYSDYYANAYNEFAKHWIKNKNSLEDFLKKFPEEKKKIQIENY